MFSSNTTVGKIDGVRCMGSSRSTTRLLEGRAKLSEGRHFEGLLKDNNRHAELRCLEHLIKYQKKVKVNTEFLKKALTKDRNPLNRCLKEG